MPGRDGGDAGAGRSLVLIGGGILWESGLRLQHVDVLPVAELSALWIAVVTVILPKRGCIAT